jgi:hypothetical protein
MDRIADHRLIEIPDLNCNALLGIGQWSQVTDVAVSNDGTLREPGRSFPTASAA